MPPPTCARSTSPPRWPTTSARARAPTKKELRNVGPSITYRLRDGAGQAREFQNYETRIDASNSIASRARREGGGGVADAPIIGAACAERALVSAGRPRNRRRP
jgi:hypothetical protein